MLLKLCQRHNFQRGTEIDENGLVNMLNLQKIYHHNMSEQKIGNCSLTSNKAMFRTLLALRFILDNCQNNKLSLTEDNIWISAFEATKKMYKEWSQNDREMILRDFMIDLKNLKEGNLSAEEAGVIDVVKKLMDPKISALKASKKLATDLCDEYQKI